MDKEEERCPKCGDPDYILVVGEPEKMCCIACGFEKIVGGKQDEKTDLDEEGQEEISCPGGAEGRGGQE